MSVTNENLPHFFQSMCCADWFVSKQVRSTEDRFSYLYAHIKRKTHSNALKVLFFALICFQIELQSKFIGQPLAQSVELLTLDLKVVEWPGIVSLSKTFHPHFLKYMY